MDITVSSRHVEVPSSVKQATVEKIGRLGRYLDGMERAEVHFLEERNPRIEQKQVCEVTMQGHGHYIRAKASAADQFAAVDLAVEKLEHQLHKLKTRLVDRHNGKAQRAPKAAGPGEEAVAEPQLVKTKRFPLKPMSLDEAILQMDLLGHGFFLFLKEDSGVSAVVYRRGDGDIGLIEAEG